MSSVTLAPPVSVTELSEDQGRSHRSENSAWRSRFGSRAVYALGDQVVFSFGNMVVAALLSRHCPQAQFGIYILTQRAMDVLIQLSNGFLWTPMTFALPSMPGARKAEYQGSIIFLQVCLCACFTGLLWLAACWTQSAGYAGLHETFQPLVLSGGGILFREFTRRLYFAELRLKEAFWTEVATVLLQIAGVEAAYRLGHLGVPETLGVLCAGSVIVSLWWMLSDWRTWTVSCRAALRDVRKDFVLGRWLFAGNLVALASAQCNPWVLDGLLGSASVGTYSICESLVNIPRAALTSMQNVMGPVVARAHHAEGVPGVRRSVRRLNGVLFAASCVFGLLMIATGPLLARLIYRTVPNNTRTVTALLAVNLVAFVATMAQTYGLTALGRADKILFANVIGVLCQALACALLVRTFHVPGAAAALLLGSLAVLLSRQWFYSRQVASRSTWFSKRTGDNKNNVQACR